MRPDSAALDARAFGYAAGAVTAALVVICSAAVAIAPEATTTFAGYIVHTDLSGFARTLNCGSFFGGLLFWTIGTGIVFGAAAAFYNRFSGHSIARARGELAAHRAG